MSLYRSWIDVRALKVQSHMFAVSSWRLMWLAVWETRRRHPRPAAVDSGRWTGRSAPLTPAPKSGSSQSPHHEALRPQVPTSRASCVSAHPYHRQEAADMTGRPTGYQFQNGR